MDTGLVGSEYAGHLTDADIRLLAGAAGRRSLADGAGEDAGPGWLRRDPSLLPALLSDPGVARAVLGGDGDQIDTAPASPFLVFAVAVHQAATELAVAGYLPERTGPRQRVPLFDVPALRDFLGSPARRLFLAELLASFTRVSSGRYRVQVRGQTRTRRYSELDPVRLAGLLDAVPESERPGVYRRLGDVSLFLTGVFPDYAAGRALGLVNAARLVRAAQVPASEADRLATAPSLELLEHLGARWYRAAWDLAPVRTARLTVVADVASRFRQARRVLNHIADRYLFAPGSPGFLQPDQ
ncbi:MAG: hypothetical protein J2P33_16075 [Actinobacteria bacterium]|nr:hypothetical protein [Actinomycetota bacterium]